MKIIKPNWPAPKNIHAFTTTRQLNLKLNTREEPEILEQNRNYLQKEYKLPNSPLWLRQVHNNLVINAENYQNLIEADGSFNAQANQVCVVLTADCLPVLICNKAGNKVAALHCGWRSLAKGIIANAIEQFSEAPEEILIWFGPAIGPQAFQVKADVIDAFISYDKNSEQAFIAQDSEHYLANIYQLATIQLNHLGITHIYGGEYCTVRQNKLFYSYRRDQDKNRMASCIWFS